MNRPDHLPDFESPPLSEVALSVQFAPMQNYSSIHAYSVWQCFRDRFPNVSEQPELPPQFEVFGATDGFRQEIRFEMVNQFSPRYWFSSEDGTELIQFQKDRLVHNWRKLARADNDYPRYERMAASYESDINALDQYALGQKWGRVIPNQVELTYVNEIALGDSDQQKSASQYVKFLTFDAGHVPTNLLVKTSEMLRNAEGNPFGRLHLTVATARRISGEALLRIELVGRGPPSEESIMGAMKMLSSLREAIVMKFTSITTAEAHLAWGRKA